MALQVPTHASLAEAKHSSATAMPALQFTRCLLLLCLPLAFLALIALPIDSPSPNVDLSWRTVLAYGATHNWSWGSDVVFTFGPLGYLYLPIFQSELIARSVIYQSVIVSVYLCLLLSISTLLRTNNRIPFYLAAVLLPSVAPEAIYLLSAAFTILLISTGKSKQFGLALAGVTVAGLASTVKVTFLLHGMLLLGCGVVNELMYHRHRRALVILGTYLSAFAIAWFVFARQSARHIWPYISGGVEISNAYSDAMGVMAEPEILLAGLAIASATTAVIVIGCFWRRLPFTVATSALLIGTLFLAWKHGFVRGDHSHIPTFFAVSFNFLILSSGLIVHETCPSMTATVSVAGGIIALWSFLAGTLPTPVKSGFGIAGVLQKTQWLIRAFRDMESLQALSATKTAAMQLPNISAAVANRTVDVLGTEQCHAIVNHLNYHPPPIFQSYAATSTNLIKLNESHYRSASAPDFVLLKMQTLDGRFPTLDLCSVMLPLLEGYNFQREENGFLLLHRQQSKKTLTKFLIASGELDAGEELNIPPGPVWCELDLQETILGGLFRTLLHTPAFSFQTLSRMDDTMKEWRLVPGCLRSGFLLSPLVESNDDYLKLMAGTAPEIKTFRLRSGLLFNLLNRKNVKFRLYAIEVNEPDAQ